MVKIDQKKVEKIAANYSIETVNTLQTVVYVMVGGGIIGHFAAEQPIKFYIDDRVSWLPYPKREIYQAVETLATLAKANGLDPQKFPRMPVFHNCGIF